MNMLITLQLESSDGLVGRAGAKRSRGPGFKTALVALSVKNLGSSLFSMRQIYVLLLDQPSRPLLGSQGVNGRQLISVLLGGLRRAALCSFLMLQRCLRSPRVPFLNNRRFQPFFEAANNNRVKNTPPGRQYGGALRTRRNP